MGLTPRIARIVYGVVGTLAFILAFIRIQSGYMGGALFAAAIAVFAAFRFYQLSKEE